MADVGYSDLGRRRAYRSWHNMLRRCLNPKCETWKYYGARGITVCERWMEFQNFYADMGDRPANKTIDRKDNNGNYEPGNCRWATRLQQARNKRHGAGGRRQNTLYFNGECLTIRQWANRANITPAYLAKLIRSGIPIEECLRARRTRVTAEDRAAIKSAQARSNYPNFRPGFEPNGLNSFYGWARSRRVDQSESTQEAR